VSSREKKKTATISVLPSLQGPAKKHRIQRKKKRNRKSEKKRTGKADSLWPPEFNLKGARATIGQHRLRRKGRDPPVVGGKKGL